MGAMRDYVVVSTALVLAALWSADFVLGSGSTGSAFGAGPAGSRAGLRPAGHGTGHALASGPEAAAAPAKGLEALSGQGLLAYGAGFGALMALARAAAGRTGRVQRQAAMKDSLEQPEGVKYIPPMALDPAPKEADLLPYMKSVPRTIMEPDVMERLLALTPRSEWENPKEGSRLWFLKTYAEVYGEGKNTKIGWWDYWTLRLRTPALNDLPDPEGVRLREELLKMQFRGESPVWLPGPSNFFYTGATIKVRGKEPFAADQMQSAVTDSRLAKTYINNMAINREGLKPWQRGIEIGMAHGYFAIGPFVSLGPLRNTPEAATVGMLAGIVTICILSAGGLVFSATWKPRWADEPGKEVASGFSEIVNWHTLGGIGGAGFAHALITVFGS